MFFDGRKLTLRSSWKHRSGTTRKSGSQKLTAMNLALSDRCVRHRYPP